MVDACVSTILTEDLAEERTGPDSFVGVHLGRTFGVRVLSIFGLCATVAGFAYGGLTAYLLLTDSFVAPLILSKDSDVVIQSKLSLSKVLAERHTLEARMLEDQGAIDAAHQGLTRLADLKERTEQSLEWARAFTREHTTMSTRDLDALERQREVIARMIQDQTATVAQLESNLDAGLVHKADVTREEVALDQLRLAEFTNDRDQLTSEVAARMGLLAQRSLSNPNARGVPPTPEVSLQQDQLVHIELESLKLEAEIRAKRVQRTFDADELEKLDELLTEMRARPIFRAIESSQDVAFVPYNQIKGVERGAQVHDCALWGLFFCAPVGEVAELVPGEVAAQDPWGTPMRGQYAVLHLTNPLAAQSRSLRVRPASATQGVLLSRR